MSLRTKVILFILCCLSVLAVTRFDELKKLPPEGGDVTDYDIVKQKIVIPEDGYFVESRMEIYPSLTIKANRESEMFMVLLLVGKKEVWYKKSLTIGENAVYELEKEVEPIQVKRGDIIRLTPASLFDNLTVEVIKEG